MKRLLIIDDEKIYQRMVAHAVQSLGLEIVVASNGEQGVEMALQKLPDIIISDVMMPQLNGYGLVRRLRRDPRFAHTPILFLTAQSEIKDKLEAFEVGADGYMTKPFEAEELVAKVGAMLRQSEVYKNIEFDGQPANRSDPYLMAVHGLRGGIGCSTLAINLGLALNGLWSAPTLIMDQVLTAGQVALMLNAPLKRTWADISRIRPTELDWEAMQTIIDKHESGLRFIAAPTYPSDAELLTPELFAEAFKLIQENFDYIVVDLPHDFSGMTLDVLDRADSIVVLLAPEIASIRAAAAALDTYKKLGYPDDKIHLVLNSTFERGGIPRKKIEAALKNVFELALPFAPDLFVEAINIGRPILMRNTKEPISNSLVTFAYQLSKPEHRSRVLDNPESILQHFFL